VIRQPSFQKAYVLGHSNHWEEAVLWLVEYDMIAPFTLFPQQRLCESKAVVESVLLQGAPRCFDHIFTNQTLPHLQHHFPHLLSLAADRHHLRVLVDHGFDPNRLDHGPDASGEQILPILRAVRWEDVDLVKLLQDKGARWRWTEWTVDHPSMTTTPANLAAHLGSEPLSRCFWEVFPSSNQWTMSPVTRAIRAGHYRLARMLHTANQDVQVTRHVILQLFFSGLYPEWLVEILQDEILHVHPLPSHALLGKWILSAHFIDVLFREKPWFFDDKKVQMAIFGSAGRHTLQSMLVDERISQEILICWTVMAILWDDTDRLDFLLQAAPGKIPLLNLIAQFGTADLLERYFEPETLQLVSNVSILSHSGRNIWRSLTGDPVRRTSRAGTERPFLQLILHQNEGLLTLFPRLISHYPHELLHLKDRVALALNEETDIVGQMIWYILTKSVSNSVYDVGELDATETKQHISLQALILYRQ
jgi:hypothetical protein